MGKTGMRRVKLKDVCRRITVGHVGPMAEEYTDEGIPFLRSQNIMPFRLCLDDIKHIPFDFHARLRKSALRPGDVAVVRTGYPGTACVIPNMFPELNCADLVIITPSEGLNPHYLAAIFNSEWGIASVAGKLVGVAQQHFNIGSAKEMEVHLPPLPTQKKIAAILSAYDDLIENNERRIRILEEMAQNLYREWFVKFRFPGHEKVKMVDSPLGKIPQGWQVKPVAEAFEILGGGTPSKKVPEYWQNGTIHWYTPSDLTANKAMFIEKCSDPITDAGLSNTSARMFPAFCVMMTSRATIGAIAINTTPACTNQGFITCIPNEVMPLHCLYFWLRENTPTFIRMASGATFKEISKGVFRTIDVLLPSTPTTKAFVGAVAPVANSILNLQSRNAHLRQTRDLLLPKLISGEVDVSELDIKVPEDAA